MNEAKRSELRAYRWRRAFRWYRIRLWGVGPLITLVAGLLLATIDNGAVEAISRMALIVGIPGTLIAAWSAYLYFKE
jgi:hypothetical protein